MAGGASKSPPWGMPLVLEAPVTDPFEPLERCSPWASSFKTALSADCVSWLPDRSDSISGQKRSPPCSFSAEAWQINDKDKVLCACWGLWRWRGKRLVSMRRCQNTCLATFSLISPFPFMFVCCLCFCFVFLCLLPSLCTPIHASNDLRICNLKSLLYCMQC